MRLSRQYAGLSLVRLKFPAADLNFGSIFTKEIYLTGPLEDTDLDNTCVPFLSGVPECSDLSTTVCLGEVRGIGAVWTVYTVDGTFGSCPLNTAVVLKLVVPAMPQSEREVTSGYYDIEDTRVALWNDVKMMTGPLRSSQHRGESPQFFGVFAGKMLGKDVWAVLVEDCGEPIVPKDLRYNHQSAIPKSTHDAH